VRRILLILELIICLGAVATGQPQYSQYQYNRFLINPSVAGSNGLTCINLTVREQWIGYLGAPATYSLSYQTRFLKKSHSIRENIFKRKVYRAKTKGRVGMGVNIYNDINGLVHRTGFLAAYSYHIWLDGETQLSLGLAGTGFYYKIDQRQIQFTDPDEAFLNTDFRKGTFIPDFSFGAYLLNRKFAIGLASQDLIEGLVKKGSQAYKDLNITRSYYLLGSYELDLDGTSLLEPSLLVKMTGLLKPQLDIGLTYAYEKKVYAGLTFRTGSQFIANIGYVKDKYFFGYSYDYTFQRIQRSTYGSHEIIVALRLGSESRKYRWLDRY